MHELLNSLANIREGVIDVHEIEVTHSEVYALFALNLKQ